MDKTAAQIAKDAMATTNAFRFPPSFDRNCSIARKKTLSSIVDEEEAITFLMLSRLLSEWCFVAWVFCSLTRVTIFVGLSFMFLKICFGEGDVGELGNFLRVSDTSDFRSSLSSSGLEVL